MEIKRLIRAEADDFDRSKATNLTTTRELKSLKKSVPLHAGRSAALGLIVSCFISLLTIMASTEVQNCRVTNRNVQAWRDALLDHGTQETFLR